MAAYVLFYPLDIVRVKQQLSDVSRPFPDVVSKLFKEEGPTSLYKGVEASAFSVAVSSAIYFFCFKSLEQILAKQKDSNVRRLGIAYVHSSSLLFQKRIMRKQQHQQIRCGMYQCDVDMSSVGCISTIEILIIKRWKQSHQHDRKTLS